MQRERLTGKGLWQDITSTCKTPSHCMPATKTPFTLTPHNTNSRGSLMEDTHDVPPKIMLLRAENT